MKNPGLQAIAFVLAILLWAFVRVTQEGVGATTRAQLSVQVPIRLQGSPVGLVPYDISQEDVRVTVKGESTAVNQLRDGDIKAYVDLNGAESSSVWPEVKVFAPGGLQVVAVYPVSVNIKLSGTTKRLVPVHLRVSGRAANGMSVGEASVDPARVLLTGPEALLEDVQEVIGQCVLGGQGESYSMQVRDLTPVNSQGTPVEGRLMGIKLMPNTVTATIPIQLDSHVVAVPISMENIHLPSALSYRFRLEFQPEVITLRMPRGQTAPSQLSTRPLSFSATTKVESKDATVVIPEGMEVVGNSTVTVKLVPEKIHPEPGDSASP